MFPLETNAKIRRLFRINKFPMEIVLPYNDI